MTLDTRIKATDYFRGADGNLHLKEASSNEAVPMIALIDADKNHIGGRDNPMAVDMGGNMGGLGVLMNALLLELKKMNIQLAMMTDNYIITDKDVEGERC